MADADASPVAPSPSSAHPPPPPVPPARAEPPRGPDLCPPSLVPSSSPWSHRWTPRGLFGAVVRGSSTTLRLDVIRPSFGRRREMDTDYKGWGGADSRRAFEQNKTFSIERLRFKATQKWRGGLFRRDADERSGAKTKARLDFGFGIELAPGGDPDASRGRTFDAFRAECRLKARVSPDDAAPRLTVFFLPKPRIAVGATLPLEGPARALLSLGRNDEAAEETKTRARDLPEGSLPLSAGKEAKTLSDGGDSEVSGGDEKKPKKKKSDTRSPRGVCVRVEAAAPLSFFLLREGRFGKTHDGVSVTARLVRPEARGAFVSTSGLEFDFPEIPLGVFKGAARDGETSDAKTRKKGEKRLDGGSPGDALALRVRGSVDFPRAGFGAGADGLGRVDGEDAPVRVSIRKLGVKRVVHWWRRPDTGEARR